MNLSVGILAGGKSTRMGQNKALLELNNQRFIDRISQELSSFNEVLISAARKGEYEDLGYQMCYDEHAEIGPIEGIYQILKAANEDYVFVCAADMPFIKQELVRYMAEFVSNDYDCFVLMDEDHIHPLCAIYSKRVLPLVEELISRGQYRLMGILNGVRTKYISLEYTTFSKKIVRNINTKDEYKKLVLPITFCVSAVKNSGKTGLIEKLINEFIKEHYKVAVIKHDGHDYVMDHKGTDTERFYQAGAQSVGIFSKSQHSMNWHGTASVEKMIELCSDVDVIIIEGMKDSSYPKIEVVRSAISNQCVCNPDTLICVATDIVSQDKVKCPVYGLNDVEGIFLCLKMYFGLE